MKEHHRRRKRSCSPNDSGIAPPYKQKVFLRDQRSASRSSDERDHTNTKKERHHHGHRRHHKGKNYVKSDVSSLNSSHQRSVENITREHRRERHHRDSLKDPKEHPVKVKEEPVDVDERVQPSSSKWDDDDHNNRSKILQDRESRQGMGTNGMGRGRQKHGFGAQDKDGPRKRSFIKKEEEDTSGMDWGKKQDNGEKAPPVEKEKPNFGLSGKLTEDSNTYKGVVIKYSEPPEARVPKRRWRLYPFKGDESLKVLYIHRASAFLLGRDRKVVDIPLDHPSCSKQHAALQYRLVQYTRDNGSVGKRIRPYIIDLESANGTYVNNNKIEPKKYVELLERDVLKFGFSSREYVLLHEHSKDDDDDDLQ